MCLCVYVCRLQELPLLLLYCASLYRRRMYCPSTSWLSIKFYTICVYYIHSASNAYPFLFSYIHPVCRTSVYSHSLIVFYYSLIIFHYTLFIYSFNLSYIHSRIGLAQYGANNDVKEMLTSRKLLPSQKWLYSKAGNLYTSFYATCSKLIVSLW